MSLETDTKPSIYNYTIWTGNEKLALKLDGNFVSTEFMGQNLGKPGQKYFETIVLFKEGLNL